MATAAAAAAGGQGKSLAELREAEKGIKRGFAALRGAEKDAVTTPPSLPPPPLPLPANRDWGRMVRFTPPPVSGGSARKRGWAVGGGSTLRGGAPPPP